MKMHLKLEISLFHSVIPRKSATWDLDTSLDLISFLLRPLHYSLRIIAEKHEGVCYHVDCQRVWKDFLSVSKKKILHLLSMWKCYHFLSNHKLILKILSESREQPEQRNRSLYINKQLSERLFCSLSCTCGCLLWILLSPLLGVRLCSYLAQEYGTSHGGRAVSWALSSSKPKWWMQFYSFCLCL